MVFINVSDRAAVVILIVGLFVVWGLVDPTSLQSTVDMVSSMLIGAFEGATGAT